MPAAPPESCTIPAVLGQWHRLSFTSSDLGRLHQRDAWLNDTCIDYCSELLLRHIGTSATRGEPAIFSVLTITQHTSGYDEALWRVCRWVPDYWNKNLWMIPINHEGNHWTLAVVYWRKRRIAYFDSFGSKSALDMDAPVIYCIC